MLETKCSAGASPSTVVDAADPLRLSFRQTLLLMAAGTNSSMMSGRCPGCETNADTSKPGSRTARVRHPLCALSLRMTVNGFMQHRAGHPRLLEGKSTQCAVSTCSLHLQHGQADDAEYAAGGPQKGDQLGPAQLDMREQLRSMAKRGVQAARHQSHRPWRRSACIRHTRKYW